MNFGWLDDDTDDEEFLSDTASNLTKKMPIEGSRGSRRRCPAGRARKRIARRKPRLVSSHHRGHDPRCV
jgi:hypothetical protein